MSLFVALRGILCLAKCPIKAEGFWAPQILVNIRRSFATCFLHVRNTHLPQTWNRDPRAPRSAPGTHIHTRTHTRTHTHLSQLRRHLAQLEQVRVGAEGGDSPWWHRVLRATLRAPEVTAPTRGREAPQTREAQRVGAGQQLRALVSVLLVGREADGAAESVFRHGPNLKE